MVAKKKKILTRPKPISFPLTFSIFVSQKASNMWYKTTATPRMFVRKEIHYNR